MSRPELATPDEQGRDPGKGVNIHDSMVWTLFAEECLHYPANSFRISAYDCVGAKIL